MSEQENGLVGGVHHICVKVPDVKASVGFYTSYLGYRVRLSWEGGAMLVAPDGTHLELFPVDSERGVSHIAYRCADVDALYRRVVAGGCAGVTAPTDVSIPSAPRLNIRMAFFRDPDGNLIELFHEYE